MHFTRIESIGLWKSGDTQVSLQFSEDGGLQAQVLEKSGSLIQGHTVPSLQGLPPDLTSMQVTLEKVKNVLKFWQITLASVCKADDGKVHELRFSSSLSHKIFQELMTDPVDFLDPFSLQLMNDPVVAEDHVTYERHSILHLFSSVDQPHSHITGQFLYKTSPLIANQALLSRIKTYREETAKQCFAFAQLAFAHNDLDKVTRLIERIKELLPDHPGLKDLEHRYEGTQKSLKLPLQPFASVTSLSRAERIVSEKVPVGEALRVAQLTEAIIACALDDFSITLWDLKERKCLRTFIGHTASVSGLFAQTPDLFVSTSLDKTIKLWSISQDRCLKSFEGHNSPIHTAFKIKGGTLKGSLATSSKDGIKIWDVEKEKCLLRMPDPVGNIITSSLAEPSDDLLASGWNDGKIRLWNLRNGQCIQTINNDSDIHSMIALSKDILCINYKNSVQMVNIHSGKVMRTMYGHQSRVNRLSHLPDGTIASSGLDNIIIIWDHKTGHCLKTLNGCDRISFVTCLNNGFVVNGIRGEKNIRLWKPMP